MAASKDISENPRNSDHLVWLIPVLLLGGLSVFVQASSWTGGPKIDLLADTASVFAALGITVGGLLRYSLHRTRLSLFLALSFLGASLIDALHVLLATALVDLGLELEASVIFDIWAAGRATLVLLLLSGLVLNRYAPVARNAVIEVLMGGFLVLVITGLTLIAALLVRLPWPMFALLRYLRPGQVIVGILYLIALPLYFKVNRRQPSPLWQGVIIALVIGIFGQMWTASSTALYDAPYVAAHTLKVIAYLVVLTGIQLLGADSEREALSAAHRRQLVLQVTQATTQGSTDMVQIVERVARSFVYALRVDRATVLLPKDPNGETLRAVGSYATRANTPAITGTLWPVKSVPALNRTMIEGQVTRFRVDERQVLDAKLLQMLRQADVEAITTIPLLVQGRSIGLVAIAPFRETRTLSRDDEELALAIAGQVAAVLDNVRLLTLYEEQNRIQTTLYEATASLNADLEPMEVLARIASHLRVALDVTACALSDWDPGRDVVITQVEIGPQDWQWSPEKIFKLSEFPATRWALENQKPVTVYVDDLESDAAERAMLEELEHHALLMLPLVDKSKSIGLIELYNRQPRRFQAHEIDLAQALAQQAGAALQRARLYFLEREHAAQLSVLNWLSRTITSQALNQGTLEEFAQRLSLALHGAHTILVYVRDPDHETLRLGASSGLPDDTAIDPALSRVRVAEVEAVLKRENPVILPVDWEGGTTTPLAQALSLQSLDPLGAIGVYVDDELALLVMTAFAPEDLPGEREEDFLLTLSASLSQNMTSQRLFEEITAERERLQAILASTTDAVVLTSRQADIVVFNATAEAFFGISQDEAFGRPFSEVLAQDAFREMAERLLEGTIEEIERADIVLSDGRVLLTGVGPVRAADGEIVGYVIDMADVTEIQSLSEQKSQVLRMASHDLLNPLGQAMGAFELLMEDMEPLEGIDQELVDNVRMGHERMSSLLRDLLDLERLEAGMLIKRQTVSASRVLEEVVAEMKPLAAAGRQTFTATIPDGLPDIDADTVQIHRALCNLVDNAFKYTQSGGQIALSAEWTGDQIRIAIRDNGIGIPKEAMGKLFQRFYRIRQPGTEDVLGTGLGLSLVKSVIELHDGTVEVDSTPGKGSTFIVTLPTADQTSP